jgi:hypothetical protein
MATRSQIPVPDIIRVAAGYGLVGEPEADPLSPLQRFDFTAKHLNN